MLKDRRQGTTEFVQSPDFRLDSAAPTPVSPRTHPPPRTKVDRSHSDCRDWPVAHNDSRRIIRGSEPRALENAGTAFHISTLYKSNPATGRDDCALTPGRLSFQFGACPAFVWQSLPAWRVGTSHRWLQGPGRLQLQFHNRHL